MAFYSQQFIYFYLVLLISIISSLFLMMNLVYAAGRHRPTGFSLELIHSDSLESKNLTQLERMERAFQQTQLSATVAASMNSSWVSNNTRLTSPVRTYLFDHYIVKVGLGTIGADLHSIFYYLTFDTGSDLLWIQCKGVLHPFHQNIQYFPWEQSLSFSNILCNDHVLCPTGECYGDGQSAHQSCKYDILYGDGSYTIGYLAKETLIVDENTGQMGQIDNFVFGCGMHQMNFSTTMGTKAVGIMGFGGGSQSIINQLGITKFEYCLLPSWSPSTDSGPSTFLRFGSDTKIGAGGQVVHTTPMYIARGTLYYVTMIGISVGGTPIRYVKRELELKSDGTGGCVFDTGTPYSRLSTAVFVPLQAYLLQYFHRLNRHVPPARTLYEICFDVPTSFHEFPGIIFHFLGGADFEIELSAAFVSFTDFFCFNILRGDESGLSVTVGGIQQGNHRILYDVGHHKLSWAYEQCVANS